MRSSIAGIFTAFLVGGLLGYFLNDSLSRQATSAVAVNPAPPAALTESGLAKLLENRVKELEGQVQQLEKRLATAEQLPGFLEDYMQIVEMVIVSTIEDAFYNDGEVKNRFTLSDFEFDFKKHLEKAAQEKK